MKAFLDTNVIVAAHEWPSGVCAEIYEHVLRKREFVTSEVVVAESGRVLKENFQVPAKLLNIFVDELKEYQKVGRPETPYDTSFDDEDDLEVLASAVSADADMLITGDKSFRMLDHEVPELSIRTPKEFLDAETDGKIKKRN
jgi:putative PIN family toxin of toxin-antitoxin system